ncbi:T9SS type B sorting domain-containing protein [Flavobacterium sp. UMI-01]|uniref:T9SS type B sorting domain-containing protein n=1 Tax=Flavobacterium sp. UMI-01 TaxID=1441053 RepID=UPI001C7DDB8A|nr:T9SS type B sorting domain-containing protein [Flavobacterium sp. UMI-01]GIZ09180.1 hypothetical protein FUMI01_19070 [Flavobacterium sp. UMI-01]
MKNYLAFLLGCIFFSNQIHSQFCTGSLGDPVLSIDFGSGIGRGSALGSSVTLYNYSSSGKLDEGFYTISNETTGLRDNAWHATTDHTGNANGYMMIVNASLLPTEGIFYTNIVNDLCPGTTYEFSAWLMNLMTFTSVNPNVIFRVSTISGVELGTYNTGQIPVTSSATWKKFGFYFSTGTESSVVITILNNAIGAIPGNDLALDDIKFRACGATVLSSIKDESGTSLEVCEGEAKEITVLGAVTSSSYSTIGYQWQSSVDNGLNWEDIGGATSSSYSFTTDESGLYKYRLAAAESSNIKSVNCRVYSNEITIAVKANPTVATFQIEQPTCTIPTGTITITSPLNGSYSIDGVNFQTSPIFSGLSAGDYSVTTKNGTCVGTVNTAKINSFSTSSTTPTVMVEQPVICSDPFGTITVTSLDFEYSFDNGQTWQSSAIKSGLNRGTYYVKSRNSTNCITQAATVTIIAPPGYPPTPTVIVKEPDCVLGTGSITITDTAAAYSFDGGNTWGSSNTIGNLPPGVYNVLIKNNLGCVSIAGNDVYIYNYVNNEPLPTVVSPMSYCKQEKKTLADVPIAGKNIKWYESLTSNTELSNTTLLTSQTYYATQTITVCESFRIPVVIFIQDTPTPNGVAIQNFCTTQKPTIATLTASGSNIKWYSNATNGASLTSTTALVDGTTYYASQTVNGCESSIRFAVSVGISRPNLIVQDVSDFYCDHNNDGVEKIDLSIYKTAITSDATTTIRFYNSFSGADSQVASSEIVLANAYNLARGLTTLYARIDSNDKCHQVVKVALTLFSTPEITIDDTLRLCENSSIEVDAGTGFDSYLWSTSETTQAITIRSVGDYSVTVTKNNGVIVCSTTKKIKVTLSNGAMISSVETNDLTDSSNSVTINLTASSTGDYEYSIDGLTYQDSNELKGLSSGTYTVYIQDKNGCGIITQEILLLNYPKFFTPNGDGYNDQWSIPLAENEPGLILRIFDRYGKLLKELRNAQSWDGTCNGYQLPADDYWFVLTRENGKIYKGHFAIER